ncbi:YtzC family protein [Bacillus sp. 03113]|uniref:YtzC family protein n=1 Tax=Bacillus sp. 03113 TaxID=2578211 RepID=UPI0011415EDC|nr:YtzC family protein [Bacillus sp. 03113]
MATRQSIDEMLQKCEDVIRNAKEQFEEGSRQEHYNDDEYTNAQVQLEETYNDLLKLAHSANEQQREQLQRMSLQIQQIQHQLITTEH